MFSGSSSFAQIEPRGPRGKARPAWRKWFERMAVSHWTRPGLNLGYPLWARDTEIRVVLYRGRNSGDDGGGDGDNIAVEMSATAIAYQLNPSLSSAKLLNNPFLTRAFVYPSMTWYYWCIAFFNNSFIYNLIYAILVWNSFLKIEIREPYDYHKKKKISIICIINFLIHF